MGAHGFRQTINPQLTPNPLASPMPIASGKARGGTLISMAWSKIATAHTKGRYSQPTTMRSNMNESHLATDFVVKRPTTSSNATD